MRSKRIITLTLAAGMFAGGFGWQASAATGASGTVSQPPVQPAASPATPQASGKKPNILVLMGDDIGLWNLSIWNRGMMGFNTPNIDSIGQQGALLSTYYGQQSCTAGRAAFITGQSPFRTGLTKVGLPGAAVGLQKEDPTIADMLKPLGYATAQFGKNHLGDRDEYLPTAHGFDEFFGNLYHLNAEEEPENPDYPKDPEFRKKFGPRGVIKATADGKIEDTGPLNKKRMETVDLEFIGASKNFIERQVKADKPFFVWLNTTRMHVFTHLSPNADGKTGLGLQADGMTEHDGQIGEMLKFLQDQGVADNTIVIYTTDNGAMKNMWPDGGVSPFRSEKDTNWEGAVRVPALVRWPGVIQPGTVLPGMFSAEDWLPTLLAAAGDADVKAKLLKGTTVGAKSFKVHLDGYNQLPMLKGEVTESPRKEFVYFDDDGGLVAYRDERFKYNFGVQYAKGMEIWRNPLTTLRAPIIMDLKADPFEYSVDGSILYEKWFVDRAFLLLPAVEKVGNYLATYKDFPPRQRPASFSIDQVIEKLNASTKQR
ncbi:arylsulfatase [Schauerella aestuarii]|uniref:arylsulfatase n=1 Tax=Schauerella aestuarii TaxID=2511204 RepID=UPI0013680400|nr:arylsulfatase [Achromobacter aestuarii]MYZ45643.1 arylsulfatase [Achromobacter aestuarii]